MPTTQWKRARILFVVGRNEKMLPGEKKRNMSLEVWNIPAIADPETLNRNPEHGKPKSGHLRREKNWK